MSWRDEASNLLAKITGAHWCKRQLKLRRKWSILMHCPSTNYPWGQCIWVDHFFRSWSFDSVGQSPPYVSRREIRVHVHRSSIVDLEPSLRASQEDNYYNPIETKWWVQQWQDKAKRWTQSGKPEALSGLLVHATIAFVWALLLKKRIYVHTASTATRFW